MRTIDVIGAHCTGKTTLVNAVGVPLRQSMPQVSFTHIGEIARSALRSHQFTRDDVRAGGERCLQLQELILQSQMECERRCDSVDLVISDRSGIDPLVYAGTYCGDKAVEELVRSYAWTELESRVREATVLVCEPVASWLFDDGIRLMPKDEDEWMAMYRLFCELLHRHQIPFVVLAASATEIDERVNLVLSAARMVPDAEVKRSEARGL